MIITNQFEATHEIKRVYQSIRLRNSLKSYAVKYKAEVKDEPSMFSSYIYQASSLKAWKDYHIWDTNMKD